MSLPKILRFIFAWSIALSFLVAVYLGFLPHSDWLPPFNSDDAIAVIMSRDGIESPFSLYYYGQNRLGSWVYMLGGWMAKALGHAPTALHIYQVGFAGFIFGVITLFWVSRAWLPVALTLFFGVILAGRQHIQVLALMNMAQPYMMFIGGFCLIMVMATSELGAASDRQQKISTPSKKLRLWDSSARFFCLMFVLNFLFIWLNRATWALMAGALVFMAMAKGYVRDRRAIISSLITAAFAEFLLRRVHYSYAVATFQQGYRYEPALDVKYVFVNAASIVKTFATQEVVFMGVVVTIWVMLDLRTLFELRKEGNSDGLALSRFSINRGLIYGFLGAFFAQFGLLTVTNWVRINGYAQRYLAPSYCLLAILFALVVVDFLKRIPNKDANYRRALALVGVYSVIAYFSLRHIELPRPHQKDLEQLEVANALTSEFPSKPLLGEYWGVYIYAALQTTSPVIPVVTEGDYDRMPWAKKALLEAPEILVSHRGGAKFGSPDNPVPYFEEYGRVFTLVRPRALIGPHSPSHAPISLYRAK